MCAGSLALNLCGQESWQSALARMPLNPVIPLNRDNCMAAVLQGFQSNALVKALVFLPAVSDDFYLINRDRPKLNITASNLLEAITALTNKTDVRATFSQGALLLHLERDRLKPLVTIQDQATAQKLSNEHHLPQVLWIDAHWERLQPRLRKELKMEVLPTAKSSDAWHFARHNLAGWGLTDRELINLLSITGKTSVSIQKSFLVFQTD
jgi:hypothetical protein